MGPRHVPINTHAVMAIGDNAGSVVAGQRPGVADPTITALGSSIAAAAGLM